MIKTKPCLNCQKTLHGRTDKKFCNDYCRNAYNNLLNSDSNKYIRNINHCLRKNRRILESLLAGNRQNMYTTTHTLLSKGFLFKYFTHTYTNRKSRVYYFCYEYGYLLQERERIVIVNRTRETGVDQDRGEEE